MKAAAIGALLGTILTVVVVGDFVTLTEIVPELFR